MKRHFYLVIGAILLSTQASFANDIENAINKYGGKIGIKGSAANLINSQIRSATTPGVTSNPVATGTPTTTTTTTTTSKVGSLKNALQRAFSKQNAGVQNDVSSLPTSISPAPAVPVTANHQTVKTKIGKEIWRQARRYETKHPNKLMNRGVNSLGKVVGQP